MFGFDLPAIKTEKIFLHMKFLIHFIKGILTIT